mmetsp:Transcript_28665/g.61495  ORF Transcript_28665/g.61495 Transcript_28665/m.61495 type:complete len:397 (+) Transcript_28665:244-1434(+)
MGGSSATSTILVYSCVQKMNDSAALLLEAGQYDRALSSLTTALRLSRSHIEGKQTSNNSTQTNCNDSHQEGEDGQGSSSSSSTSPSSSCSSSSAACGCFHYSLDGCIHYSEDKRCHLHHTLKTFGKNNSITDNCKEETLRLKFLHRREQRRLQQGVINKSSPLPSSPSGGHNSNNNYKNGDFLYRQLIQVPAISVHECHDIAPSQIVTLSIIIIFNLAMTYHLRAISMIQRKNRTATVATQNKTILRRTIGERSKDLEKALKLYDVAYRVLESYRKEHHDSYHRCPSAEATTATTGSAQFKLILCNNLSHVHRLAGNRLEHRHYLEEVLSTIMSLIDLRKSRPPAIHNQSNNSNRTSNDSNSNSRINEDRLRCIDLEGFLANAAPLMSNTVCADAA